MSVTVGIDAGTSSVKAVAVDSTGAVLGVGRVATPWRHTSAGTEMDAGELTQATVHALAQAVLHVDGQVGAIGVTGMAESGVMLGADGLPAGPLVAWHDPRGERQELELRALVGDDRFSDVTGQPLSRRLTAVKYRRLRSGDGPGGRWLTVPEWILLALGGDPAPELSQWSRTGFLDVADGSYDPVVCDWAGLPWRDLARPVVAGTPAGRVGADVGLASLEGAVLTSAGHDHLCAAFGAGADGPADVCDSWGNGEALVRVVGAMPDVRDAKARGFSVSSYLTAGHWALFRGLGSGLVLRAVLRDLGVSDETDRVWLDERAARADPAELPVLTWRPDGQLATDEAPAGTDPAVIWRAALAAVFDRVRLGVDDLTRGWGPVGRVVGVGGWLASEPIRSLKQQAVPDLFISGIAEPAAVGAAVVAARALSSSLAGRLG